MFKKIVFLILIFQTYLVVSQNCSTKPEHVLCSYMSGFGENCGSDVELVKVPEYAKSKIVSTHNAARNMIAGGEIFVEDGVVYAEGTKIMDAFVVTDGVAPPASDMMKLYWDAELEKAALGSAKRCLLKYSCHECLRLDRFQASEKIYRRDAVNRENLEVGWSYIIGKFFKNDLRLLPHFQSANYSMNKEETAFGIMLKAELQYIGCAKIIYKNRGKYSLLAICIYGPTEWSKPIYRTGKACSNCPHLTRCTDKYEHLCGDLVAEGIHRPRVAYEDESEHTTETNDEENALVHEQNYANSNNSNESSENNSSITSSENKEEIISLDNATQSSLIYSQQYTTQATVDNDNMQSTFTVTEQDLKPSVDVTETPANSNKDSTIISVTEEQRHDLNTAETTSEVLMHASTPANLNTINVYDKYPVTDNIPTETQSQNFIEEISHTPNDDNTQTNSTPTLISTSKSSTVKEITDSKEQQTTESVDKDNKSVTSHTEKHVSEATANFDILNNNTDLNVASISSLTETSSTSYEYTPAVNTNADEERSSNTPNTTSELTEITASSNFPTQKTDSISSNTTPNPCLKNTTENLSNQPSTKIPTTPHKTKTTHETSTQKVDWNSDEGNPNFLFPNYVVEMLPPIFLNIPAKDTSDLVDTNKDVPVLNFTDTEMYEISDAAMNNSDDGVTYPTITLDMEQYLVNGNETSGCEGHFYFFSVFKISFISVILHKLIF